MPVMLREVLELVQTTLVKGPRVLDLTLGTGGHSEAVLKELEGSTVVGVDRDPSQAATVARLREVYGEKRFTGVCPRKWSALSEQEAPTGTFDAVVADLGLCTTQLEERSRGFSFRGGEKDILDMRMGGGSEGSPTASELLDTMSKEDLANMFAQLGQEPQERARALGSRIVKERPIHSVAHLTKILRTENTMLVPKHLDPATLGYQAIRMVVNDEINQLFAGLVLSARVLKPGGLLIAISYHSIEDRIVKKFIQLSSPQKNKEGSPAFQTNTVFMRPEASEVEQNPRSSSATLRYAVRSPAPFGPESDVTAQLRSLALKRRV